MAGTAAAGKLGRLEDYIAIAREGKAVQVTVDLMKIVIIQRVHPGETEEASKEIDSYLLQGDFSFVSGVNAGTVSKIYVVGSMEESLDAAKLSSNVANQRLKMDYNRLKDAGIRVEERYF